MLRGAIQAAPVKAAREVPSGDMDDLGTCTTAAAVRLAELVRCCTMHSAY